MNVRRITKVNWAHRVYRVASKCRTMAQATKLCRDNGVLPNPSLMAILNPQIEGAPRDPK